jgi:transcriptional regulator with XRE-family HTH domain
MNVKQLQVALNAYAVERKLTQQQLKEITGVSQSQISRIMAGKSVRLSRKSRQIIMALPIQDLVLDLDGDLVFALRSLLERTSERNKKQIVNILHNIAGLFPPEGA